MLFFYSVLYFVFCFVFCLSSFLEPSLWEPYVTKNNQIVKQCTSRAEVITCSCLIRIFKKDKSSIIQNCKLLLILLLALVIFLLTGSVATKHYFEINFILNYSLVHFVYYVLCFYSTFYWLSCQWKCLMLQVK